MPRRSTRSSYPRRTQSIAPTWGYLQSTGSATILAPSSVFLMGSFVQNVPAIEETVLRTRGVISINSDQSAAVERQQGAFGMIVVSEQAFTAGVASLPSPVSQGGNDEWFVHQSFAQQSAKSLGTGPVPSIWIDSKAMRKVPEGYRIALIIENADAAMSLEVLFAIRILGKVTQG